MRCALASILALLILAAPAAAQVSPPLLAAAVALDQSTTPCLEATYAYSASAANTHAAWVLVRSVATIRSQARTLLNMLSHPVPPMNAARDVVHHMNVTANRIDQLLSAPIGAGHAETLRLREAWTRTTLQLRNVTWYMR